MQRQYGQTISEYSLIAILIGIVAVGGLAFLGGSLENLFGDLLGKPPQAEKTHPSGLAVSMPPTIAASPQGTVTPPNLSKEAQAAFEGFQKTGKLTPLVETLGANGSTEIFLSMLESVIQQKLAAGEITQGQANALQGLANKGHAIAEVERLMELKIQGGITAGKPNRDILKQTVEYRGENWTVLELYGLIGSSFTPDWGNGVSREEFDAMRTEDQSHDLTYDFYEEFLTIQEQGLLDDPAANDLVSYLSNQIAGLSEGLSEFVALANKKPTSTPSLQDLANKTVSYTTDMHSAGICTTGQSQDSGTNCQ